MELLRRYARFLHTGFPAGVVEPLPAADAEGRTAIPGLRIAGDLLGTPLLKLAVDSGARAGRAAAREVRQVATSTGDGATAEVDVDVAVVGAGPAGIACALAARDEGARVRVLDAREPFATVRDFPARKPIYLYPTEFVPDAPLALEGATREALLDSLVAQRERAGLEVTTFRLVSVERSADGFELVSETGERFRARRIVLAVGRSGDRRRLGVSGEDGASIRHRLHDPAEHVGRRVLVVGGGDSAVEAAIAIADAGGTVALVHRGADLARAKPENRASLEALVAAGRVDLHLRTRVLAFESTHATLEGHDGTIARPFDDALVLIGREPPHALLRRLGLRLEGERTATTYAVTAGMLALASLVYTWKSGGAVTEFARAHGLFPFGLGTRLAGERTSALAEVLRVTLEEPGFHYSLVYSLAILGFGLRRIARTPTPYVRRQTLTLGLVQWIPLFVVPYLLLPWLGRLGWFDGGLGATFADAFFPRVDYGHGREYWRAFGFVLAFPLFLWNVFTSKPSAPWLVVSAVQTFVLVPLLVRRFGKGAYCGWICSCGALAETAGDSLRARMPHGPRWNRLNLLGQGILAASFVLLALRIVSWTRPHTRLFGVSVRRAFDVAFHDASVFGLSVDYYHVVDLTFAGILGVGLYVALSGRAYCRFACPLAALMHVYARLTTRFRIFASASRCIACGKCTSVCHQGIDVMAFAVRGAPMDDPQCVRCSACVASCPTAALSFGRLDAQGAPILDALEASPVRLREDGRRVLRVLG